MAEQGGRKRYSVPISVEEAAEMAKPALESAEKHREEVRQRTRHSSNVGNHPVMHDRENTWGVFEALLERVPEDDRDEWRKRWRDAVYVEQRRRDYDREWDRSLATISWGGQGGG